MSSDGRGVDRNSSNAARAEGHGSVYQSAGDQHIVEHHHHEPRWPGQDSVRRPSHHRSPTVLRDRTELVERLQTAVAPAEANGIYVMHGLGGCGKTAVARALFEYASTDAGRVGLWIDASDLTSLRSGMFAVAADRGAAPGELAAARSGFRAAADLVWEYLDASAEPWLLVLDNADDPAILRNGSWLRASSRGIVLVTTRQAATRWWPDAELLHVGTLPLNDAAQVLCDLAPGTGGEEEAARVAESLGRLPLALTLAGTFLGQQVIEPWSMDRYGQHLGSASGLDPIDLLDQGATRPSGDSRHLVSRTWQLSLDALMEQDLPEARDVLRVLACFSNDPLPLPLLAGSHLSSHLSPLRLEAVLRGLIDHSLTELLPGDPRCLRTHGVLLDSVASGTPREQRADVAGRAARLLLRVLPEEAPPGIPGGIFPSLAPHVVALLRRTVVWECAEEDAEAPAECARRLVAALHESGDYPSALSLAEETLGLVRQLLGVGHPTEVRIRRCLGRALHRLGRFDEAEGVLRDLVAECERSFGVESADTLDSYLVLASPVSQMGTTAEAVDLIRRVATGRAKLLGSAHPATLRARAALLDLAGGPELRGEVSAQDGLVEECYRELGADHEVTLSAEHNYAHALLSTGKPAEGLPHARAALTKRERINGPEYPVTLSARHCIAEILMRLGENEEACTHADTLVQTRRRVLGPNHPWTSDAERLRERAREGL